MENLKLSQVKEGQFVKFDSLIMLRLPNGEFDCAMPNEKLKSGKFELDVSVQLATKEEFINAVNSADHKGDWYSLLLKELMLDRVKEIA